MLGRGGRLLLPCCVCVGGGIDVSDVPIGVVRHRAEKYQPLLMSQQHNDKI